MKKIVNKVTWKAHLRAQVKKGPRALWSCNAFIGRAWGLSPKMTLWLYKRVIIPKITHAAVARWDIMDIALARFELQHLQRTACIMITGAIRTTPTRYSWNCQHLESAMESAALMAAYCQPMPDPRNLGIGHNRIWAKADKVDNKFNMIKDHVTLRCTYGKYRIVISTREEWGKN